MRTKMCAQIFWTVQRMRKSTQRKWKVENIFGCRAEKKQKTYGPIKRKKLASFNRIRKFQMYCWTRSNFFTCLKNVIFLNIFVDVLSYHFRKHWIIDIYPNHRLNVFLFPFILNEKFECRIFHWTFEVFLADFDSDIFRFFDNHQNQTRKNIQGNGMKS